MNAIRSDQSTHHTEKNSIFSRKTVGIYLGLIALIIVALTVLKVSFGTLFFAGALLLCPILHVWMMKDGDHKH